VKPETQSFYELAVRRAVERVVQSLDDALDLESLARSAALSPFHFHRIFRGMLGETPLELHRRLRMERAALRLLENEASVTTIALEAGYDTHEAFTRAFRVRYNCSPSEFRQDGQRERTTCERPRQIEIAALSGIHFHAEFPNNIVVRFTGGDNVMNVTIKHQPEYRTATLRHIGPYNQISQAFERLGEIAGRAGLLNQRPIMLGIYYDDPETTSEKELRSDAAVVISEDAQIPEGLTEQRLPAGRYATTTHVGPYEQLGDVWARFMGQWLPQSGQRIGNGSAYEIHVNNPTEVPKHQLQTELYIPLV
jgi:AraC family transcriptional regulator